MLRIIAMLAVLTSASSACASDSVAMQKVKMGILPTGGFYEMFDVTCRDESVAMVVSTERRRRWCTQSDGQVSCFKRPQEASYVACSSEELASSEVDMESYN